MSQEEGRAPVEINIGLLLVGCHGVFTWVLGISCLLLWMGLSPPHVSQVSVVLAVILTIFVWLADYQMRHAYMGITKKLPFTMKYAALFFCAPLWYLPAQPVLIFMAFYLPDRNEDNVSS